MSPDVIIALAILSLVLTSVVFGVTLLLSYLVIRMLRSDGWDKSNMTNALRLLSHVAMHPQDFAHMVYIQNPAGGLERNPQNGVKDGWLVIRPFWYIGRDELSEVVQTRPRRGAP